MSDNTKASHIDLYSSYNFAGSVEWAVDLAQFVESVADEEASENITALEEDFTAALSTSGYDISEFTTYNLSDLATRLVGFEGCELSDTFPITNAPQIIYSVCQYGLQYCSGPGHQDQGRIQGGGTVKWETVWGPALAKILARWGSNTGAWTMLNTDSITLYGFAKYIQDALGNIYPHLPLAKQSPVGVSLSLNDVVFDADGCFTVYANDTIIELTNTTLLDEYAWSTTEGVCAEADDEEGDPNPSGILTIGTNWAVQSEFPSTYHSSWSSWAGLATATSTSAAARATTTWILAVYSDTDCSGDYYSLEGHNVDSTPLRRASGSPTAATLTQPKSWSVVGGVCTAYDTTACSSDGTEDAYIEAEGCHNYLSDDNDTQTWIAVQCGAEVDLNGLLQTAGDARGGNDCVCVLSPGDDDSHRVSCLPAADTCYHSRE
ncbi:hypothetical protein M406DRAFT_324927 [Cryphonectria parasitica EP155]|uniref:Secreted LysM effector LysM C-terminal domain-containing protein n=1 Tax=Cryphonectria parasitica (strain ATCC 38755 / EP155) TaxID=660469 RepID=A0A9P4Y9Q5_CRYP1|nr:uncharacterized protein M406DRAFT_324927 [Cryphonectria parasitica EP155]KAF3769408.1 hypothetical protein M406DRAFT_324927 [Cryphonectria parasitica EP155]